MQPDFKELLELFNAHGVDYVIVGAHALAFHGVPRYTGGLDLLVAPEEGNARRILDALDAFGFGSLDIRIEDLTEEDRVVQLGVPPVRIDILTAVTGVTWNEVRRNRVAGTFGEVPTHFLGRDQLVANKRACGRHKDLADLEALGEELGS